MKRKVSIGLAAALLLLGLAGCGRPALSVKHQSYQPNGLAAVVKGTSRQKAVQYQTDGGKKKTEKTHNGSFALTIPAKMTSQKVVLSANGAQKKVTVGKTGRLVPYSKLRQSYNQALTATALSKADKKKTTALQAKGVKLKQERTKLIKQIAADKKKLAAGNSAAASDLKIQAAKGQQLKLQGTQLRKSAAEVKAAMNQAQKKVQNRLLPTQSKAGIHNLVTTKQATIRTNIDHHQVVGVALMVPTSILKNKTNKQATKNFAITFSLLANGLGANAKQLMKDFQKESKSSNTSQTTTKPLHSNGMTFAISFSAKKLYIYMTK